jgi:F-box-like
LPSLTINHLPDEILLEIFDFYRQGVDSYDHQWREKYAWFNLTHLSRRWRAITLASSSRLDLGIIVGPIKPAHIEPILSSLPGLPILIDFKYIDEGITIRSAVWRMRTALGQHDRVRGVSFTGTRKGVHVDEFFSATDCHFPILESLVLSHTYYQELELPDTFLGGPDLSNLHLRRLELERFSLTSVSRFLLSTSSLTDLALRIDTALGTSPKTPLLACLQGMPCLSRLDLEIVHNSPSQFSAPNDIVPLSKLTYFHYSGHSVFLDAIVAGISAPSVRNFSMQFFDAILFPLVHLTRFITETEKHHRALEVAFLGRFFCLSLLTHSDFKQYRQIVLFNPIPSWSPETILRISGSLSTKLATVEELRVAFSIAKMGTEDDILWRRFYQLFPGVKVLHTEGANYDCIARTLLQYHEEPEDAFVLLPALEEMQIGNDEHRTHRRRIESARAVFKPFISARRRAGRPVKVFFRP